MSDGRLDRHPLESLGRGALITFVGQLVLIGATFGSRVLLVRSLSNAEYGEIALGLATVSMISPFASLGIPYGVTRQMAHAKSSREKYDLAIASAKLLVPLSILAGVVLYLAAPAMGAYIHNPGMDLVLQYMSVYLTLAMLSGLIGAIFQGEENMVPSTLFTMIVSPILLLVLLVGAFRTGATLSGALLAYVLSTAGALVGLSLYAVRERRNLQDSSRLEVAEGSAPRDVTRELFLFSVTLTMLGVASVVTGNVEPLVLGYVTGSTGPVGTYSALLTISRLLLLGVGSLSFIALPVASRLHRSGNLSELGHSYATMIKWILVFFVPLYALFVIFPSASINLVYGPVTNTAPYASAPTVLRILATGTIAACFLGPAQSVLTGIGKLRLLFYDTITAAAVDVVGSFVFVPLWGIDGAALAFTLSTITLPLLAVVQTGIYASVHPFRREVLQPFFTFWVIVFIGLALPAAIWHWHPGPVTLAGLFFVMMGLYLALILATRSLVPEDRHLLGVLEGYLGRPIPPLRAVIRRFTREPSTTDKHL